MVAPFTSGDCEKNCCGRGMGESPRELRFRPENQAERLRDPYCNGAQCRQSVEPSAVADGVTRVKRITPSEVVQKLLTPVLFESGVARAVNSSHLFSLHRETMLK